MFALSQRERCGFSDPKKDGTSTSCFLINGERMHCVKYIPQSERGAI